MSSVSTTIILEMDCNYTQFIVKTTANTYAQKLLTHGQVVVPTSFTDPAMLKQAQAEFINTLKGFPEFTAAAAENNSFVLGAFSALGNAGSFHNHFVRQLRQTMHTELYNAVFKELLEDYYPDHNLEQLIDRMMHRPAGRVVSGESLHRDESGGSAGDLTLGGWLNLNDEPQEFHCDGGRHILVPTETPVCACFKKVPKIQQTGHLEAVEIPAGHAILFVDNIMHEVVSKKYNHDLYRLFLGFRLTRDTKPLIPGLRELLKAQAVVPLKSAQVPPMYSKLHLVNWLPKVQAFSASVRPELLTDFTYKTGKRAGKTFRVAPRFMPSLEKVSRLSGIDAKYEEYCPQEWAIHIPHRPRVVVVE